MLLQKKNHAITMRFPKQLCRFSFGTPIWFTFYIRLDSQPLYKIHEYPTQVQYTLFLKNYYRQISTYLLYKNLSLAKGFCATNLKAIWQNFRLHKITRQNVKLPTCLWNLANLWMSWHIGEKSPLHGIANVINWEENEKTKGMKETIPKILIAEQNNP